MPTNLPTDIDATYADEGSTGRKLHQQHHDALHGYTNTHDSAPDPHPAYLLETAALGLYTVVVEHGATAGTARPAGAALVVWVGSVAPTNGAADDLWEDTATPGWLRYSGTAWVSLGGGGGGTAAGTSYAGSTTLSATNVEAALDELDVEKLSKTDASAAYAPLGARAARAFRSAALGTSSGATIVIPLDAETFDTAAMHDNATNPSRIVLNKLGLWRVDGMVGYQGNGTGVRHARIHLNGALHTATNLHAAPANGATVVPVPALIVATAITDYVELAGYQDSGASVGVHVGTANTWLAATYVGTV